MKEAATRAHRAMPCSSWSCEHRHRPEAVQPSSRHLGLLKQIRFAWSTLTVDRERPMQPRPAGVHRQGHPRRRRRDQVPRTADARICITFVPVAFIPGSPRTLRRWFAMMMSSRIRADDDAERHRTRATRASTLLAVASGGLRARLMVATPSIRELTGGFVFVAAYCRPLVGRDSLHAREMSRRASSSPDEQARRHPARPIATMLDNTGADTYARGGALVIWPTARLPHLPTGGNAMSRARDKFRITTFFRLRGLRLDAGRGPSAPRIEGASRDPRRRGRPPGRRCRPARDPDAVPDVVGLADVASDLLFRLRRVRLRRQSFWVD